MQGVGKGPRARLQNSKEKREGNKISDKNFSFFELVCQSSWFKRKCVTANWRLDTPLTIKRPFLRKFLSARAAAAPTRGSPRSPCSRPPWSSPWTQSSHILNVARFDLAEWPLKIAFNLEISNSQFFEGFSFLPWKSGPLCKNITESEPTLGLSLNLEIHASQFQLAFVKL